MCSSFFHGHYTFRSKTVISNGISDRSTVIRAIGDLQMSANLLLFDDFGHNSHVTVIVNASELR